MICRIKITTLFFILIINSLLVKSQTIEDLIRLNQENTRELHTTRGVSVDWRITGYVDNHDILEALNVYSAGVGLLMYDFIQDTLQVALIDQKGEIMRSNYPINEDTLINKIKLANNYFSIHSLSRSPQKRGARIISSGEPQFYEESFIEINKILLPFDQNQLKPFNHIIIVPTLNISIIPFSALKISEEQYLIDMMSYSIAPSLYELMVNYKMRERRRIRGNGQEVSYSFENALFVANPMYPEDSIWNFPSLPGTEIEVNSITDKLESWRYTKLTGDQANLDNVRKNICQYDLLYFATHGISDEKSPLDHSFIILTDGKLTTREIQNIKNNCLLKADLVILSACQTGLGKAHKGGLVGISRGFQIAGANHVLMSLWNISDSETAKLMGLFFDNLMKGGELMPHEALRQAILTYKNNVNDDPNYWAPFSIFGTPF